MIRLMGFVASVGALLFSAICSAGDDFVPVDPSTLDTVDGELMLTVAYSVITGLIAIYSVRLFLGQKKVRKKTKALLESIENAQD